MADYKKAIVADTEGIEWEAPVAKPASLKSAVVSDTSDIEWEEPSKPAAKKPTGNLLMDIDLSKKPQYQLPKGVESEDVKATVPQRFAKEEEHKDYGRTSRAFKVAKERSKYGMPTELEVKRTEEELKAPSGLEEGTEGLETPWISPAFIGAGVTRAAVGALSKDALKVASGKGFAAGSLGGDVAAWTAHEAVDKSLTPEFKEAHPVLSETMKVGAALIGGISGGMAAERRYMQRYDQLLKDVDAGKVAPSKAEEILGKDSTVQDIIGKVEETRAKYAAESEAAAKQAEVTTPAPSTIEEAIPPKAAEDLVPSPKAEELIPEPTAPKAEEPADLAFTRTADEVAPEPMVAPKAEDLAMEPTAAPKIEEVAPEVHPVVGKINQKLQELGVEPLPVAKPLSVQAERVKAAQEIPVGGSEDAARAAVKQVFTKQPDSVYKNMTAAERQAYDAEYERAMQRGEVDTEGNPLDDFGRPLFSKQVAAEKMSHPAPTTIERADEIARKLLGKQYDRVKATGLKIVQSVDDLPESLVNRADIDTIEAGGRARGVFDPQTGNSYIIAGSMSEREIAPVIVHELIHRSKAAGEKVLGTTHDTFVLRLKQLKEDPKVMEAMKAAQDAGTPAQHIDEEVMAYLVENFQHARDISPKLKRFINDIMDKIKEFISKAAVKLGVKPEWLISKMSSDEIANILRSRAIRPEAAAVKEGKGPLFSQAKEIIDQLPEGVQKQEAKSELAILSTLQKNYNEFRANISDLYSPIVDIQKKLGIEEGSMHAHDVAGERALEMGRRADQMEEVNNRIRDIEKRIVDRAKSLGASADELRHLIDQYLISKHTPEVNKYLGEDLLGGAAGRKTQEAKEVIKAIGANREVYHAVREFAKEMQGMAKESLDILLDAGVINREMYNGLRSKYKYYIPMHRIIPDEQDVRGLTGGSSGASVKGTGIKKRVGSQTLEVADVMGNIAFITKAAIDRAAKNENANRLWNMFEDAQKLGSKYYNEEVAKMVELGKPKVVGQQADGMPIMERIADDGKTLFFQKDGKPHYIRFKDQMVADAARELTADGIQKVLPIVPMISRFMAAMFTRYNIAFAPANLLRDQQEMAMYLASLPGIGAKGAGLAAGYTPKAMKGVVDDMLGKDTEYSRLYKELREEGGTIGGFTSLSKKDIDIDVEEIRKDIATDPRRALHKILKGIDMYNQVFEDASRIAAYKAAKEMGMSKKQAAWIARNSTIDFGKKGKKSSAISQLYIFFNPSIRGTVKMIQAMKNPKVATAVISTMGAAVYGLNQHNDRVDPDWREKISEGDAKSSLIYVLPNKEKFTYVMLPLAWGVKPVYKAMTEMYDLVSGRGDKSISERAGSIFKALFDSYSPIQGDSAVALLTPTALKPVTEIAMNQTGFGTQIRPDWMAGLPRSEQVFKDKETGKPSIEGYATGRMASGIAETAHNIGIEFSPHDVEYALRGYLGGPYTIGTQAIDNLVAQATGDKIKPKGMPIVSKFYKQPEAELVEKRMEKKPYKDLLNKLGQAEPEDRKLMIAKYVKSIPDKDRRKSVLFKLGDAGFDIKGISSSMHPQFPVPKMKDGKFVVPTKEDIMIYHIMRGASDEEAKQLSDEYTGGQ